MSVSNLSTGMRPGVCLSSSRPAVPYEGQMIYETDTDLVYLWSGSAWVETVSALTKAPRGVMGYVYRTAGDISHAGGAADVTGMSITFTAVANRLYKATWSCVGNKNSVDRDTAEIRFTDSVGTVIGGIPIITLASNVGINFSGATVFTTTAGSKTYKLQMRSFSGTTIFSANTTTPLTLIIEDIGAA